MKLNLKPGKHVIQYVEVYLYTDEHVVIPRYSTGVYGSVLKNIDVDRNKSYYHQYYVIKNKLMFIEKDGQRCNNDGAKELVGKCIVTYLEDKYNCTAYQLMASKTKKFCPRKVVGKINDENNIIQDLSDADVATLTGCLPSCNRDEISLRDSPKISDWPTPRDIPTISLKFLYHDGTFIKREEYLVYDTSNFIADVGGYLGLLVGQSILGIYYMSADWVTKMKLWRCV